MFDQLGDKQSEIIIDAALLEVADELLLNADIQGLELYVLPLEQVNGVKMNRNGPGGQYKDHGVSSQPQRSSRFQVFHRYRKRYSR